MFDFCMEPPYVARPSRGGPPSQSSEPRSGCMTIVVTDNCQLCRFTECVSVCPVACFHGDDRMVYIDNDVCIDCRACIPVCPVKAICSEEDLSPEQMHCVAQNAEMSRSLPVISDKQEPLPTAERRRAELGY